VRAFAFCNRVGRFENSSCCWVDSSKLRLTKSFMFRDSVKCKKANTIKQPVSVIFQRRLVTKKKHFEGPIISTTIL
jgi:hypothetical protein